MCRNEYTQLYLKEQERREIMEYYSEDNEMVRVFMNADIFSKFQVNNSLYNSSIEEEWIRMQEWEKVR